MIVAGDQDARIAADRVAGASLQLLVVRVDGQRYGLDIAAIARVVRMVAVAPLPEAPALSVDVPWSGVEAGLFKVVVSLGRDGTGRYRQQSRTVGTVVLMVDVPPEELPWLGTRPPGTPERAQRQGFIEDRWRVVGHEFPVCLAKRPSVP